MSITLLSLWASKKLILNKRYIPKPTSHTSNVALNTIHSNWEGTPLDQKGKFI